MKVLPSAVFLLASLFLLSAGFASEAVLLPAGGPRWEKLGRRQVNRAVDRDEILVTAREGVFTAVKLRIRNSGINMHRMVIHFRNGQPQEITLRNNLPAGGETRVIDLDGRRRIITKVVFWYDTQGLINDKAVVELWGRH